MSRSLTSSVLFSLSYIHTCKMQSLFLYFPKVPPTLGQSRLSVWWGRGWGKKQLVVTMVFMSQDLNNLQMSITHPSLEPLISPVPSSSATQLLTKSQKIPPNHLMCYSTSPLYIHEVERKLRVRETEQSESWLGVNHFYPPIFGQIQPTDEPLTLVSGPSKHLETSSTPRSGVGADASLPDSLLEKTDSQIFGEVLCKHN